MWSLTSGKFLRKGALQIQVIHNSITLMLKTKLHQMQNSAKVYSMKFRPNLGETQ